MKKFPVALQLYSVRDDMAADFAGTLEKVAGMGYQGVEFAGLYDHTPDEVRALCERYGLTPISAHVPYAEMIADPAGVLGAYKAIGCRYIAIPYYQWNFAESGESYEQFMASAKAVKQAGYEYIRGGAFKPRTSPYSFQGLGEEGLKILSEVSRDLGLKAVTEVLDAWQRP